MTYKHYNNIFKINKVPKDALLKTKQGTGMNELTYLWKDIAISNNIIQLWNLG